MNTCIHSASHGTVNSVNTRSATSPSVSRTRNPLPPSLPRASQLAARALDGQVELVVRAVGAVRVGVPLLHQRLVAGVLRLLLQVERLVAVDELVRLGVAELRALLGLDAAVDRPVALGRSLCIRGWASLSAPCQRQ